MAAGGKDDGPSAGAIGGAGGELGSDFRAAVGAWIVAHALIGKSLPGVGTDGRPAVPNGTILPESDAAVDDLEVQICDGGTLFIQAKHALSMSEDPDSPFGKTVMQCCGLVRNPSFDAARDRIAIVVGDSTKPLQRLRAALDRRRAPVAGAPAKKEVAALDTLLCHVDALDHAHIGQLLQALHVVILDLDAPESLHRERAEQWLAQVVVEPGNATEAFEVVEARLKKRAARRMGLGAEEWMNRLRGAGIDLRVDQETPAARLERTHRAMATYFQSLQRRASELTLDFLLPGCPPLTIPVHRLRPTVEVGSHNSVPLNWAQRRRGRVLLTGLPGVGKSTALRHLAAQHAGYDSPLPLFAALPRVLDNTGSALDRLVADALRDEVGAVRAQLADAAVDALTTTGRAMLLLDSLDECRDRAPEAIEIIRQALRSCHPDVEVVLATRDSAYVAAESLIHDAKCQWSAEQLTLEPPSQATMKQRLTEVARGSAQRADPPEAERAIAERVQWVLEQLERASLRTPLAAWTLLALSGSGLSDRDMPRGKLLSQLIEHLADRWELIQRRRGAMRLVSAAGATEMRALLLLAFDVIGARLSEAKPTTAAELQAEVARVFQDEWRLAVGPAGSAATEAIHFWDEAGVFIAEGRARVVRPRLEVFTEIAHVRRISRWEPAEVDRWVQSALDDPIDRERLRLLAGLSRPAAETLLRSACDVGTSSSLRLAAHVIGDLQLDDAEVRKAVANALLAEVQRPVREHWDLTGALVDIAPPSMLTAEVEARIRDVFGAERAEVFRAHAELTRTPTNAPGVEFIEALPSREARGLLPRAVPAGRPSFLDNVGVDALFESLILRIARAIRSGDEDAADAVVSVAKRTSSNGFDRVLEVLQARGFDEAVSRAWSSRVSRNEVVKHLMQRTKDELNWTRLLGTLAGHMDTPVSNWKGARRLDMLTMFIRTLCDPHLPMQSVEVVLDRRFDLAERAVALVVELGRFNAWALGEEVLAVTLSIERLPLLSDAFAETARSLAGWSDGPHGERQLDETFALLESGSDWLAEVATRALDAHPEPDGYLHRLHNLVVTSGYGAHRRRAAWLLLRKHGDPVALLAGWLRSTDSFLAKVAARANGLVAADGDAVQPQVVAAILAHEDGAVREAFLRGLDDERDRVLRAADVHLDALPAPECWSCNQCGTEEEAATLACSECDAARPKCEPWFGPTLGLHVPPP